MEACELKNTRTLEQLFALLHHRRLTRKKLLALSAPSAAIERQDKLISNVSEEIGSRIDNIAKWQERFDMFFSMCADCEHFVEESEDIFCQNAEQLPPIVPDMEPRVCEFFKKSLQAGSTEQKD
jgi:hypothetical protein